MRRVMVFGSFDPLHEGHRSLFRQARRHGDELVVVVARDKNIRKHKGHDARKGESERLESVKREPLVDSALLGDEKDYLKVVVQHMPDVIILGYDQESYDEDRLKVDLEKRGLRPEIMRAVAFRPEVYKSSKMA